MNLEDRNGKLVAKVEMAQNRMFKMNLGGLETRCLKTDVEDKVALWHRRFGHLGFAGLQSAARNSDSFTKPDIRRSAL